VNARAAAWLAAAMTLAIAACTAAPAASSPSGDAGATPVLERLGYTCASVAFDPAILDGPATGEQGEDAAAAALRAHLATPGSDIDWLPDTDWIRAGGTEIVEFVARRADRSLVYVAVHVTGGTGSVAGWGDCRLRAAVPAGINVATWRLADPAAIDVRTTGFAALVTEGACASGQAPGTRLLPPVIAYQASTVEVLFGVRSQGGLQTCPSNPEVRVDVVLVEPLGGRRLVDVSVFPPGDPASPPA